MIRTDRLERAQARMRAAGVDAYLVLTHDDFIWFFGEDRYQPRAIIPAQGPPIVVVFRAEEEEARASLGVDRVRVFGTVGQQILDVVQEMRRLAGDRPALTVGIQMGFATPAFLVQLFQRANPWVKVADIAPVMDELRMIKEPEEIETMRRAAAIADLGMAFEERPMPTIHPTHTAVEIRADMVLTVGHSVLAVPGIGGVRIEDTFHVTAQGAVPLTRCPVDLAPAATARSHQDRT